MRRHFQRNVGTFIALLFLSVAQFPATAQIYSCGVVEGRLTSVEGWVIPKAKVRLLNKATKEAITIETDVSGNYKASCLAEGTYDVLASALGFKQAKRKSVKVEATSKVFIDLVMKHDLSGSVDRQHQ